MEKKIWRICHVDGEITACDPGRLTTSVDTKIYRREELKRGTNLTAYNEHLPQVVVREVGDDFLTVTFSGKQHKLTTGTWIQTPQKGLSYAYSEATIYLEEEAQGNEK